MQRLGRSKSDPPEETMERRVIFHFFFLLVIVPGTFDGILTLG